MSREAVVTADSKRLFRQGREFRTQQISPDKGRRAFSQHLLYAECSVCLLSPPRGSGKETTHMVSFSTLHPALIERLYDPAETQGWLPDVQSELCRW